MTTPNDNRIRVTVRVLPETYELLKQIAAEQSRTVNFQVEHYIKQGVKADTEKAQPQEQRRRPQQQ